MTADLSIANVGPHALTEIALFAHDGTISISGGSQTGKSMIYESVCVLLTGKRSNGRDWRPEAIREGVDKMEIRAAFPDLGVASLSLTRGGTWNRSIADRSRMSQRDFEAQLGTANGDLVRFIVAPVLSNDGRCATLIDRDLGRPLRDLLLSALPEVDTRDIMARMMTEAGFELLEDDPIDLDLLLKAQTKANTARDSAVGVRDNARERLATLATVEAPSADDVTAARATLAARDAWATYWQASAKTADTVAKYTATRAGLEARANAPIPAGGDPQDVAKARGVIAAACQWVNYDQTAEVAARRARRQEARAKLGERPVVPALDPAAPERLAKAPGAIKGIRNALDSARAELAAARIDCDRYANGSDVCPTCERGGWDGYAVARGDAKARVEQLTAAIERESARLERAEAAEADLRTQVDAHKSAKERAADYDRALAAIGDDPPDAADPVAPAGERPTEQDVSKAYGVIAACEAADRNRTAALQSAETAARALKALVAPDTSGAVKPAAEQPTTEDVAAAERVLSAQTSAARNASDRASMSAEVAKTEATAEAAIKEATRVAEAVKVCRQAPSAVAAQQRSAFDLPSWIGLRFPPKEKRDTPECEVLIDGLPYYLASTGRRTLADLYLRHAVRKAAGVDWLPIFVDNAQDYSGDYPNLPRVAYLWTTQDDRVTIEYGSPA